ncbi:putative nucleoside phosphatase GDA1/CD39 [Helianthus anomalus]
MFIIHFRQITFKSKASNFTIFRQFRPFKLATAIVTVLLLILIGYYIIHNHEFATNSSYFTVVLDRGSSGTRVNVYVWMPTNGTTSNNNRNLELPILLNTS